MRISALLAVTAALTLAPAQALAVDGNPGTGECSAVIGSGGVFWDPITNQFCAADSGFGAGNGGNDGSFGIGPGGGIANGDVSGEEIIEIEELLATKVQPTKSPKRLILLPGRGGGGGWGKPDESTDGPGRTAPRGGSGSGTKGEEPTEEECEEMEKNNTPPPSVLKEIEALNDQIILLQLAISNSIPEQAGLETSIKRLKAELPDIREWEIFGIPFRIPAKFFVGLLRTHYGIYSGIYEAQEKIAELVARRNATSKQLKVLRAKRDRVKAEGEAKLRAVLRRCGALYDGSSSPPRSPS